MNREEIVLSFEQMATVDRAAVEDLGIPPILLMENASRSAWDLVVERVSPALAADASLVFAVGSGNNGGDALAMARHAHVAGYQRILCFLVKEKLGPQTHLQREILERLGIEVRLYASARDRAALHAADIIVDGVTGNGLSSALHGQAATLVSEINDAGRTVVSIDLPSGTYAGVGADDPLCHATWTIVTGFYRRELFSAIVRPCAGTLARVEPGFPALLIHKHLGAVRTGLAPAAEPAPRVPAPDFHKGRRGRVLVVGGGDAGSGAPLLSAYAAARAGAGMVRLADDGSLASAAPALEPSLQLTRIESSSGQREPAAADLEWADALVVGPGYNEVDQEVIASVCASGSRQPRGVVLDAGALRTLAARGSAPGAFAEAGVTVVLTPHPGEMAGLAQLPLDEVLRDPLGVAERTAARYEAIVVLKGAVSVIAEPRGETVIVDGRCPTLAVAGSGDVLAGVIAAELAAEFAGGPASGAVDASRGAEASACALSAVERAVRRHLAAGRRLEGTSDRAAATARTIAEALR